MARGCAARPCPQDILPELLRITRTALETPKELKQTFDPGSPGPHLELPAGRTDVQLRSALFSSEQVQLLRVSLSEAGELLKCFEDARHASDMQRLARHLFAEASPEVPKACAP